MNLFFNELIFGGLAYVFRISDRCSFKEHFSMYCPGCGATRALNELLSGHLFLSVKYNPIVLFIVLDAILIFTSLLIERKDGKVIRWRRFRFWATIAFAAAWLFISVYRDYLFVTYGVDLLGDFS